MRHKRHKKSKLIRKITKFFKLHFLRKHLQADSVSRASALTENASYASISTYTFTYANRPGIRLLQESVEVERPSGELGMSMIDPIMDDKLEKMNASITAKSPSLSSSSSSTSSSQSAELKRITLDDFDDDEKKVSLQSKSISIASNATENSSKLQQLYTSVQTIKTKNVEEEEEEETKADLDSFQPESDAFSSDLDQKIESNSEKLGRLSLQKALSKQQKLAQCRKCHPSTIITTIEEYTDDESLIEIAVEDFRKSDISETKIEYIPSFVSIEEMPESGADLTNEVFELLIYYIQPTETLLDCLNREEIEEFKFCWNFLNYSQTVTFNLQSSNAKLNIDYYKAYPFTITETIYLYLVKVPIPIELFVVYHDETTTLLGKAELKISKAFADIGRIFETKLNINNLDLCLCTEVLEHASFGTLICRYSLKGNPEIYKLCQPVPIIHEMVPVMGTGSFGSLLSEYAPQTKPITSSGNLPEVTESELLAFQEGLNLVLVRNKALRTTQAEITNELKERTTWMHEELKWRLTLQEHAILSGKDPNLVKWRQWKDDNTAKVKYRPLSNEDFVKENRAEISIIISELMLNPYSRVASDDTINNLYVEYFFLRYSGRDMETVSKRKPDDDSPIVYDFRTFYTIHKNEKDARVLADMIKNYESIVFTLVSEPTVEPREIQSCVELGTCQINLFELVQNHTDIVSSYYPIIDVYPDACEIGKIKIIFTGILSLRSLALHVLTPETFKILR